METINNSERIINSWSLIAFARTFGRDMAVGTCKTSEGVEFPACSFTKEGKRVLVHFGKSLEGGLTFEEIASKRDELQVVQLNVPEDILANRTAKGVQLESYILCKMGENSWKGGDILAGIA